MTARVRQWTGVYASAPAGWVGGLPHAIWMQHKMAEAKKLYGFCLVVRDPGQCPRCRVPLTKLDGGGHSRYGCERCADDLGRLLHAFDMEFVRSRSLHPPIGARYAFGGLAASRAFCVRCGSEFSSRGPKHVYCTARCQVIAKAIRDKSRSHKKGAA